MDLQVLVLVGVLGNQVKDQAGERLSPCETVVEGFSCSVVAGLGRGIRGALS